MKTLLSISTLAGLSLILASCQQDKNASPEGFWRDSTGMALFQVKQDTGDVWTLSSTLGSLHGTRQGNSIRGVTDLNDSFSIVIEGDKATYSVLGVTIDYLRIPQNEFDSLTRLQNQ